MKRWREPDGLHLDLRGLEPPEPMVAVLGEINAGTNEPMILHMDRDPIFLYAELEERGWSGRRVSENDVAEEGGPAVIIELKPETRS